MKDKLSVLIGSCDSYSKYWNNFDILFKRYWKVNTNNIFVGETKPFSPSYINVLPGTGLPWGERILAGLDKINTEYVVFLLEDYYLTEEINKTFLEKHVEILKQYNADKVMFDKLYPPNVYYLTQIESDLYKFDQFSPYLNSVQPAIWKTEFLKIVLKPEYSPWEFELKGNDFTSKLIHTILLKARPSSVYFNLVRKGNILSSGWEEIFKKENLTF